MGLFSCLVASLTLWIFLALFFFYFFLVLLCVLKVICLRWERQHFCHDLTVLEMTFFVLCLLSWEMNQFSLLINAGWSLAQNKKKPQTQKPTTINIKHQTKAKSAKTTPPKLRVQIEHAGKHIPTRSCPGSESIIWVRISLAKSSLLELQWLLGLVKVKLGVSLISVT